MGRFHTLYIFIIFSLWYAVLYNSSSIPKNLSQSTHQYQVLIQLHAYGTAGQKEEFSVLTDSMEIGKTSFWPAVRKDNRRTASWKFRKLKVRLCPASCFLTNQDVGGGLWPATCLLDWPGCHSPGYWRHCRWEECFSDLPAVKDIWETSLWPGVPILDKVWVLELVQKLRDSTNTDFSKGIGASILYNIICCIYNI